MLLRLASTPKLLAAIDAHEIVPNLWQGSYPPAGEAVRNLGFDVLVLCARELQPPADRFQGVQVVYAPNDDSAEKPFTAEKLRIAKGAAGEVALAVRAGRRVLVTCLAGRNRSGLVTALALHTLYGWAGNECIRAVRAKRVVLPPPALALTNREFLAVLSKLKYVSRLEG